MKKIVSVAVLFAALLLCLVSCGKTESCGFFIDDKPADALKVPIYSSDGGNPIYGEGIYSTIVELIEAHGDEMKSAALDSMSRLSLVEGDKTEVKLIGIYEEGGTKTSYDLKSAVPSGKYIVCAKKTYSNGKDFSSDYLFIKIEIE